MGEWAYYDNGVSIGPDGSYYKNGNQVWSPSDSGLPSTWRPDTTGANAYGNAPGTTGSSSSGSLDGFWGFLGNLGTTYANVWAQTTLAQQNLEGQQYLEGQRLRQQYGMYGGLAPTQPLGIPPLFLLIGGALLFMSMAKD